MIGKEGNAGMLAYSTSKAAVIGLTKVIGKEYAYLEGEGVDLTCNAVAPAVIRTEMVSVVACTPLRCHCSDLCGVTGCRHAS